MKVIIVLAFFAALVLVSEVLSRYLQHHLNLDLTLEDDDANE